MYRGLVIRISEFQFFAHSKGSGMNKLRFFFFTEYDILQINIFVTIFWKPHCRLPKSEYEQNTRKHKEHWFIPGDA